MKGLTGLSLLATLLLAGVVACVAPVHAAEDTTPPVLTIRFPTEGQYIGTGELEVEIGFHDTSTFSAVIEEGPFYGDRAYGATTDITPLFTPHFEGATARRLEALRDIPMGRIQLRVSISDNAGNKQEEVVRFTIGIPQELASEVYRRMDPYTLSEDEIKRDRGAVITFKDVKERLCFRCYADPDTGEGLSVQVILGKSTWLDSDDFHQNVSELKTVVGRFQWRRIYLYGAVDSLGVGCICSQKFSSGRTDGKSNIVAAYNNMAARPPWNPMGGHVWFTVGHYGSYFTGALVVTRTVAPVRLPATIGGIKVVVKGWRIRGSPAPGSAPPAQDSVPVTVRFRLRPELSRPVILPEYDDLQWIWDFPGSTPLGSTTIPASRPTTVSGNLVTFSSQGNLAVISGDHTLFLTDASDPTSVAARVVEIQVRADEFPPSFGYYNNRSEYQMYGTTELMYLLVKISPPGPNPVPRDRHRRRLPAQPGCLAGRRYLSRSGGRAVEQGPRSRATPLPGGASHGPGP